MANLDTLGSNQEEKGYDRLPLGELEAWIDIALSHNHLNHFDFVWTTSKPVGKLFQFYCVGTGIAGHVFHEAK